MLPIDMLSTGSDGEIRLYAYVARHTLGFRRPDVRLTDDEIMHGRFMKGGTRMDAGSGIASRNRLKRARQALIERGEIVVTEDRSDLARLRRTYAVITTVDEIEMVSTTDTPVSTVDSPVSTTDTPVSTVDTRTQGIDLGRDLARDLGTGAGFALSSPPSAPTPKRSSKSETPGYPEFRAAWDALYATRSGGRAYPWDAKANGLAAPLLKAHGLAEVTERASYMFSTWRTGVPDLGTLSKCWATLVPDVAPPVALNRGAVRPTGKEIYVEGEF